MARIILARVSGVLFAGALMFGTLAALEQTSEAQTMRCWREICFPDPRTGRDICTREEIVCPPLSQT